MKTYKINECFLSLQGEGVRVGTANVFLRFSGCNRRCTAGKEGFDCDTSHHAGQDYELAELLKLVVEVAGSCRWVILTGGEPCLQVDDALVSSLRGLGFSVAMETNGTLQPPDGIDWLSVSPHGPEDELVVRVANEVRYVMRWGDKMPEPKIDAHHYCLSPRFDEAGVLPNALEWCIEECKKNPTWRLSVQAHKLWRIR